MRKLLFLFFTICCLPMMAQAQKNDADSTSFKGYLYNKEYNVYLQIDFYHQNVIVPRQEVYGEMAGYFGDCQDGRKWLFTSATIKNDHIAEIEIINDYGSEDLKATLTKVNDSTFVLHQGEGSTIKIARNRKWVKMPKDLTFSKR
ncbi:hypothetical protein [Hallella mizrahii]|jgi:hypothetical protein|uniref:Uncharacterized protein n=1 Tax=Hallella mizrahii TaxID=2606637 RepID=A0A7K0KGC9_9BACT|nr:hypothetical protein [Hallella mizrahii]MST84987.1 hypothetical protein [Hallella mizrahii]